MYLNVGVAVAGPISDFSENISHTISTIKNFIENIFDMFYTFFTFIPQPFRNIFLAYFVLIIAIMVFKIVSDKV